jgi:hypothetical protein
MGLFEFPAIGNTVFSGKVVLKDSNASIDFCCRSSNWTAVIPNFLDSISHSNMDTCASTMLSIGSPIRGLQCRTLFFALRISLLIISICKSGCQIRCNHTNIVQDIVHDIGYDIADIEYVSMLTIYLTSGRSRSRIRNGRFNMRIFIRSPVMCFPSCCLVYMS